MTFDWRTWRKRPIENYNATWLGVITLVVIGTLVAAVLVVGSLDLGKRQYRAEFVQAATLSSGDLVTVAGVSVGVVKNLELAGDHVVVTFTVGNDVHLGADTTAAIKLTTMLGSRYLSVAPKGGGALRNQTISLSNTTVPYDLQKTLADATTTFEQVDANQIAESMSTLTRGLDGVPEALPQAMRNVRSLSAIIAARRDQLSSLLAGADKVISVIHDQQTSLGSLVVQGRDLLTQITSRREAVQRLFASATALIDVLKRVLDDAPGVDSTIASMHEFTKMITDHDALLRNILQIMPISVRNIANAGGNGTYLDGTLPAGPLVDSWMCAISGRAKQFNLVEYFQDCK